MSDILNKIIATKTTEVAAAKAKKSLDAMQAEAATAIATRDFVGSIRAKIANKQAAVIAEI